MKKLLTDNKVCTGCRSCEAMCSIVHSNGESNPSKARIRVREDIFHGTSEPVVCRQCNRPKCVEACGVDALHQDPKLGNPVVDPAKCNGCMACVEACPFGAMYFEEEKKLPLVCDLCGGDPMCVKFCRVYPHKTHAALGYVEPKEWSKVVRGPALKG